MFLDFLIECFKVTTAISENKSKEKLLSAILIVAWFVSCGGMTIALFSTTEIIYRTLTLGIFFCAGFVYGIQIILKVHKKKLLKIIGSVYSEHPKFPDFVDKNITRKAETEAERKFGLRVIILVSSLGSYLFTPYLYFFTKPGISFDDPDLQIIPYFYPWWKTRTAIQYIYKTLFEMLTSSTTILSYYNFVIFMIYAVSNTQTHIREVNILFKNAIDENLQKYMAYSELNVVSDCKCDGFILKHSGQKWKHEFEKSIRREIIKLIKYQQFLHSHISEIASFLNIPFSCILAWYISSTILFSYAFLRVDGNYLFIVKIMLLVGHSTWALFVFCDAAEVIHHMVLNEQIMDSFYNTEWYLLLPESRKDLLFILTLCQRKYRIKCFNMYVVNLGLFILALRTVYSALNIIAAAQKK